MKSFRTEIENPIVEKDIIDLENKIAYFKEGKIDEERFRSLRLARGVYGQRQPGVQMIRIKIPFGKLDSKKLLRISEVSDQYSNSKLHITTRQDIQIHHVGLEKTPALWAELEKDEITLREACGNTVRNITASETSGIDLNEPFDPRPYADAVFKYFLRNPICQEMGRKFKISFSNTPADTSLAFIHDMGFIAKIENQNGLAIYGFQVWIAGGLGSQSMHGSLYKDFVPVDKIIPLIEAVLRVFERYGERTRRMKARLKFLVKEWGLYNFIQQVENELQWINPFHPIPYEESISNIPKEYPELITKPKNWDEYNLWKSQNVFLQKDGNFAIGIKVRLGDFYTEQARKLAFLMKHYAGDELTLTINQNIIIRHIEEKILVHWFSRLSEIGLTNIGFNRFSDITACPGTDTCNLGIASSTGLALVLENIIQKEYPSLAINDEMNIKISGCMNSCGQHMIATIGFQGMSIKTKDKRVLPATQIIIGGGILGGGQGRFGDKILKIPSKRVPEALRILLDDYLEHSSEDCTYLDYYNQVGEKYFYNLLKPLTFLEDLSDNIFVDWGHSVPYIKAIGIGECAGVVIDLISTLFFESEEKLENAKRALEEENFRDSIYHSYAAIINTAKALLIAEEQKTNTHVGIISNFENQFIATKKIDVGASFAEFTLKYKTLNNSKEGAEAYFQDARNFYQQADQFRKKDLGL